MSTIRPLVSKIDDLMPANATGTKRPQKVALETVIAIIDLIERTLDFDAGYSFDWEAYRAALEYYSRIAAPDTDKDKCWVLAETGRTLSRIREGGRPSDAPQTYQDRQIVRTIDGELPVVMFFRQEGREEDGWRGHAFWWPVLFVPSKSAPSVFAETLRDDGDDQLGGTDS